MVREIGSLSVAKLFKKVWEIVQKVGLRPTMVNARTPAPSRCLTSLNLTPSSNDLKQMGRLFEIAAF